MGRIRTAALMIHCPVLPGNPFLLAEGEIKKLVLIGVVYALLLTLIPVMFCVLSKVLLKLNRVTFPYPCKVVVAVYR